MELNYTKEIKELVLSRLYAIPPDITFSIGNFGNFTPSQLIAEVKKDSEVGKATIDMQIAFIKRMPTLVRSN